MKRRERRRPRRSLGLQHRLARQERRGRAVPRERVLPRLDPPGVAHRKVGLGLHAHEKRGFLVRRRLGVRLPGRPVGPETAQQLPQRRALPGGRLAIRDGRTPGRPPPMGRPAPRANPPLPGPRRPAGHRGRGGARGGSGSSPKGQDPAPEAPRYQRMSERSIRPCSASAPFTASRRIASRLTSKPGSLESAEVSRQPMR